MAITSIKNTFEQLKTFESIFGTCCTNFHLSFFHDNLLDVDLDDFFSELKVL